MMVYKDILCKIFNDYINIDIDIINHIIDDLLIYKWTSIRKKIQLRINILGFGVISILKNPENPPPEMLDGVEKKIYYIENGQPLIPRYLKLVHYNRQGRLSKIKIIESGLQPDKYVSIYPNGAVIWDNDIPRLSCIDGWMVDPNIIF